MSDPQNQQHHLLRPKVGVAFAIAALFAGTALAIMAFGLFITGVLLAWSGVGILCWLYATELRGVRVRVMRSGTTAKGMSPELWVAVGLIILTAAVPSYVGINHWLNGELLKREIAYDNIVMRTEVEGGVFKFLGFDFRLNNVGTDTIVVNANFMNIDVDGTRLITGGMSDKTIIPQTQGIDGFGVHVEKGIPLSFDTKIITAEFEIDYDTIPASGIRKSYRKYSYGLTWPNGKNNNPTLISSIISEYEK